MTALEDGLTTVTPEGLGEDDVDTFDVTDRPPADGGRPRGPGRRIAAGVLTAAAAGFVFLALVTPVEYSHFAPGAFARVPIEALVFFGLLAVLPRRVGRIVAVAGGILLGLLLVIKIFDIGFYATLNRPFDPVLDWSFFGNGLDYVRESMGHAAAVGAVIGSIVLAVLIPVFITLAVRRLGRIADRHRGWTLRAVAALAVVWVTAAVLGTQLVRHEPVASRSAAVLAYDEARQVPTSIADEKKFSRDLVNDPVKNIPGNQLLNGLKGKDVIFAFIESYGRSAVEDPRLAPGVDPVLENGTAQLKAAGFAARSGWLTSSTAGGGSWLAHSTLLTGLWVNNEERHQQTIDSTHSSLTGDFQRAGWRTTAIMPATTGPWPDGKFFDYDQVYNSHQLGYRGPHFGWAPMPDQYVLQAFQDRELGKPDHKPQMSEVVMVSSHAPWAPIPQMVPQNELGDGSVFYPMQKAGKKPAQIWPNAGKVRAEYGKSIQYSLTALIDYMKRYATKNTVLVFLGDHQPAPIVTGSDASRDVPIAIVAKDPAVLNRISSWNWQDGLKPGPDAPVWRMDAFYDKFLTAFAK